MSDVVALLWLFAAILNSVVLILSILVPIFFIQFLSHGDDPPEPEEFFLFLACCLLAATFSTTLLAWSLEKSFS